MDTSVKKLISMGPLEDNFIYYDLRDQVFFWRCLVTFQSAFLYLDVSVFDFRDNSPCQIYPT